MSLEETLHVLQGVVHLDGDELTAHDRSHVHGGARRESTRAAETRATASAPGYRRRVLRRERRRALAQREDEFVFRWRHRATRWAQSLTGRPIFSPGRWEIFTQCERSPSDARCSHRERDRRAQKSRALFPVVDSTSRTLRRQMMRK